MIPICLVLSAAYGPRTMLASLCGSLYMLHYLFWCDESTTSSENLEAHRASLFASVGIVVARLMELEPEKER
jgi:hypothetical protein